MKPAPTRRHGGFTLLEVLVTIVIFALLFAVLAGGWFQALQAQARMDQAAQHLRQQQQLAFALREALIGLASPRPDRGTAFAGTRRGFVGETTASLAPRLGQGPLQTSLQFEGSGSELTLRVEHPGLPPARYPWRLQRAELRYFDAEGRPHDRWPPVLSMIDAANGQAPALPVLVEVTLQFEDQAQPTTLLAAPRATPWALDEPRSPFQLKDD